MKLSGANTSSMKEFKQKGNSMSLIIQKVGENLYEAKVTPPHSVNHWHTEHGLSVRELIEKLKELGCHQIDIGDALDRADTNWEDYL